MPHPFHTRTQPQYLNSQQLHVFTISNSITIFNHHKQTDRQTDCRNYAATNNEGYQTNDLQMCVGSIARGQGQSYGWMWAITRLGRAVILMRAFTRMLVHAFARLLVCCIYICTLARMCICMLAGMCNCAFAHSLIFAFADSLINLTFNHFIMSSFALLSCKLLHV